MCGSCGQELPFATERCPRCGVPRFAFAAAEEARHRSEEAQHLRQVARALAVGLAPMACAGLILLLASAHPTARLAGVWMLGLALAGEGYALSTHRRARRGLE